VATEAKRPLPPTQPWDAPWNEVPAREPTDVEVTPVLAPSQSEASKSDASTPATEESNPPPAEDPSPASSALLEQPEPRDLASPEPAHRVVQATAPSSTIPDSLSRPVPGGQLVAPGPKLETVAAKWSSEPPVLPEQVSRSLLLHEVAPGYPDRALQSGVQGTVVLQALVGKDGSVRDLKLVRGYFVLAQAAIDAVKQWRYQPYRVNGEIVEMQTLVTIDFKHP
jgi:protein TonB